MSGFMRLPSACSFIFILWGHNLLGIWTIQFQMTLKHWRCIQRFTLQFQILIRPSKWFCRRKLIGWLVSWFVLTWSNKEAMDFTSWSWFTSWMHYNHESIILDARIEETSECVFMHFGSLCKGWLIRQLDTRNYLHCLDEVLFCSVSCYYFS